ncbi:hypothetical protein LMH87_012184 [Akanthomyces muscarius]|uniref:Uncharacterized protein n=1 Tax=Akanthomyces muscarius TaxID=2231603 RepID=A0A9W8ULS7_AKAMU|nr:hypothetical protein LMH87_012184 [Akanthomyces muscarius]KAJ4151491.1 hypothetical protein LMH87_012184 [Akanthomyces muscarius]
MSTDTLEQAQTRVATAKLTPPTQEGGGAVHKGEPTSTPPSHPSATISLAFWVLGSLLPAFRQKTKWLCFFRHWCQLTPAIMETLLSTTSLVLHFFPGALRIERDTGDRQRNSLQSTEYLPCLWLGWIATEKHPHAVKRCGFHSDFQALFSIRRILSNKKRYLQRRRHWSAPQAPTLRLFLAPTIVGHISVIYRPCLVHPGTAACLSVSYHVNFYLFGAPHECSPCNLPGPKRRQKWFLATNLPQRKVPTQACADVCS